MAHSYAHFVQAARDRLGLLHVYGPWGRPDMAMWLFAKAILAGEPIKLFKTATGGVPATYADVGDLMRDVDFKPATPTAEGVKRFVA